MRKRYVIQLVAAIFGGAALGTLALPLPLQEIETQRLARPQGAHIARYRRLGRQIVRLRAQVPTVDRVVLVPDTETFLAAISAWSLDGRWPILIEDDRYTPLFLKRFAPREVVRWQQTAQPGRKRHLKEKIRHATAAAWGADPASLKRQWQQLNWRPPGVVVTTLDDPAWPGAVALAADRGQPLLFLNGDYGKPNGSLKTNRWQQLQADLERVVARSGYPYAAVGDTIDTVTIVRSLPLKYRSPQDPDQYLAVTDGLARHADGRRWAIAGWIAGSSSRSVYQAMCAIFLTPRRALFYDSYQAEPPWNSYQMRSASQRARSAGIAADLVTRPEASVATWQAISRQFPAYDWIFINSRGQPDRFEAGDGLATTADLPQLQAPAAVHFIHSWSATNLNNPDTLAARWLANGAYLYVGSVHEPYLNAFTPPSTITRRLLAQVPFIPATRYFYSDPWRLTTIGDPLATALPNRPRRAPEIP